VIEAPVAEQPSLMVRLSRAIPRWILPAYLVALAAFLLAPIVVVLGSAFTSGLFPTFPPDGLSLRWMIAAMEREEFVAAFMVSVKVAALVTVIALIVGTATAMGMLRFGPRQRAVFSVVFLSPLMFPHVVIGVGLLQWFLYLGLQRSYTTLIAGHLMLAIPYVIRLVMASMIGHADIQERAARSLGASALRAFMEVTLPNIRASLIGAGTFAFIVSLGDVNLSAFLSSSLFRTLPIALMAYVETEPDPMGSAVSAWIVLFGVTALLIIDRMTGLRSLSDRRAGDLR
jgi:putative spermidine/putrescine transport system permease protein